MGDLFYSTKKEVLHKGLWPVNVAKSAGCIFLWLSYVTESIWYNSKKFKIHRESSLYAETVGFIQEGFNPLVPGVH